MDNSAAFVAEIAEQSSSGGAEAKHRIFHHRLARTDGRKEISEVVVAVAVSMRGFVFLVSQLRLSHGVGKRILFQVRFTNARLHRISEGSNH